MKRAPVLLKLSNGVTLIYLETENDPISACHLFLPGGVGEEPVDKSGVTTLRWSLLLKGTKHRNARQLAEDIESLGASIGAGATHDYSEISCHSVSEHFSKTLEIMGEVIFQPVFVPQEVEKEKIALIAAIRSKKESIFSVASEELNKRMFPNHPYGRPSSGEEKSVEKFTVQDLLRAQKNILTPSRAVLAAASNMPVAEVKPLFEKIFGASVWAKTKEKKGRLAESAPNKTPQCVERIEHFEQAFLLTGVSAPSIQSKDYVALKLLNSILGGGMSARLFQQLREKEGLAYDVGSYYPTKLKGSSFVIYMGLQFARLEESKKRIQTLLDDIQKKKVSATELAETKSYMKGTYILDHQTNSQRAHYLGFWHMLGLTAAYDHEYIRKIDAVTAVQIQKAAKKYFGKPFITIEIHPQKSAGTPRPMVSVQ